MHVVAPDEVGGRLGDALLQVVTDADGEDAD
jgi:hypothetical protein